MNRNSPALTMLLASILIIGVLGGGMYWYTHQGFAPRTAPVIVYCAEAMRVPMEAIKKQYEKETEQPVEIRYGASQTVLTQMEKGADGDLFFPADDSYIAVANKRNLLHEVIPVASMSAVVVVAPNTPRPVKTWDDFLAAGDKIGLANPEAAAIGKLAKEHLEKKGLWKELEKRKPTFLGKISDVGSAVQLGTCQVGILWDSVAKQYPKAAVVHLPELDPIVSHVQIAVTKFAKDPGHALHFARYVAAKDKGLKTFAENNYRVTTEADEFADRPTLRLFGGSMLRPAIERTIADFAKREGVQIDTKYNGCGILLAEMKTYDVKAQNGYPDIFFACEPRFLKQAEEHFGPPDTISSNALVVAWRKDRNLEIEKFADLGEPGLKLGIGHENQCAMGLLTQEAFQFAKPSLKKVYGNVVMRAPAGDLLVVALRTVKGPDTLDVVVCYESNVKPYADEIHYQSLQTILKDLPESCAYPDQPVAVCKESKYPRLARRLLDAMQTPESKQRFLELGFKWKLDEGARTQP